MFVKRWEEYETNIILDNYYETGLEQIQLLLPHRTIQQLRSKIGHMRLKQKTRRKIFYDESFFDVPTIQNSYWAGFIAADGNVSKRGGKMAIKLACEDAYHLYAFKDQIGLTGNLQIVERGVEVILGRVCNVQDQILMQLRFTEKWESNLLKYWNVTPKKSLTMEPPNIEDEQLSLAYIIGLIDGDGSIFISRENHKYKRGTEILTRPTLKLLGTKKLLLWAKNILDSLSVTTDRDVNVRKCKSIFVLKYTGKRAIEIVNKLKELPINWKLSRKWDSFNGFSQHTYKLAI